MWAYDADTAKMWIGRNGTWYHGDHGAGTNSSFQNMPTSNAYYKLSYATTGGSMTFEILINQVDQYRLTSIHSTMILILSEDKRLFIALGTQ